MDALGRSAGVTLHVRFSRDGHEPLFAVRRQKIHENMAQYAYT